MRVPLILLLFISVNELFAQRPPLTPAQDSARIYPLIKSSRDCGVFPVEGVDFTIDTRAKYKVLLDVTVWSSDSSASKKMNPGLTEIGRQLNLHIYAGVPLKNINMVAAVHGPALRSLLNNEAYRRVFKTDNPNIALIKELKNAGITLIACGQALFRQKFSKKDLLPDVQLSLSAKTTSSYFQSKGYAVFLVNEE